MSDYPDHTCSVCGHTWRSPNAKTARDVIKAAKINKDGPWCSLCLHIEMAARHAQLRALNAVAFQLRKTLEWMAPGL